LSQAVEELERDSPKATDIILEALRGAIAESGITEEERREIILKTRH
jgi:hypothetical protein